MEENNIFHVLNNLLKNTDLSDVSAEGNNFPEIPDGYYLCEVEKAQLKETKTSHEPMVSIQFKITENGVDFNEDLFVEIPKTKNRKVFINWVLKDESGVKRFVTDMLKFEGDVEGEPVLPKEYFTTAEILEDALDILIGMRIYVNSSTTKNKDGTTSNWKNLISWKRAKFLDLLL